MTVILPAVQAAIEAGQEAEAEIKINNTNRVAGTVTGSEISKRYGAEGLPDDTIRLHFTGSAGQSFGAFVPKGMTLHLNGDSNDYVGKGLSGGKIIVKAPDAFNCETHDNVIIGNVAFYGATSGEAYINGRAGERFAVRNSGVNVVVEGIGDHGCEYMTGGRVVVLGEVGKNFGAGMSGGIAYVLSDDAKAFKRKCNIEMISFEKLTDEAEIKEVQEMVKRHAALTNSKKAADLLDNWEKAAETFIKVIPKNYKQMLLSIEEQKAAGLSEEDAIMYAFEANTKVHQTPAKDHKQAVVQ